MRGDIASSATWVRVRVRVGVRARVRVRVRLRVGAPPSRVAARGA